MNEYSQIDVEFTEKGFRKINIYLKIPKTVLENTKVCVNSELISMLIFVSWKKSFVRRLIFIHFHSVVCKSFKRIIN